MFAEDLHHPAVRVEMVVVGEGLRDPRAVGDLEHVLPTVGVRLVRTDEPEIAAVQV